MFACLVHLKTAPGSHYTFLKILEYQNLPVPGANHSARYLGLEFKVGGARIIVKEAPGYVRLLGEIGRLSNRGKCSSASS